jgi:hypothetical protein
MGIHIRLDASALDQLIEKNGDEFFLQLSQSVVEEVCRRRVKAIVPKEMEDRISTIVRAQVDEQVGTLDRDGWKVDASLHPRIVEKINSAISEGVNASVTDRLDREKIIKHLNETVDDAVKSIIRQIDSTVEHNVYRVVNKQIAESIERQVKERIELLMAGDDHDGDSKEN